MALEPVRKVIVGCWEAQLLPRQRYEAHYTATRPGLGFAYENQIGTHAIASDKMRPFHAMPNGLAFVPQGCDVYSDSGRGGEYLVVSGFTMEAGSHAPFSDRIDPQAIAAAHALRRLFLGKVPADPLCYEALFITLLERLQWQLGRVPDAGGPARWMTPARLKIVVETIEANLGAPLTVQTVAAELGLSAGFLSRAFRAATGLPPHAYIIDRRLAKVRTALSLGGRDLSALAMETGFSSHAHLSTLFRQKLGVSPSVFREHLRSVGISVAEPG